MNRTAWIIIAALTLLGLGALIISQKKDAIDVSSVNTAVVQKETDTTIGDHVYGKADAKVVLIEYGDYQCPGCEGAYTHFGPIFEKYKDKIAFVFRNFPLTQAHPNALAAASFAEAAGLQGKYWDAYNLLYGHRDTWVNLSVNQRDAQFDTFAKQLGLKIDQYHTDMTGKKVARKIAYDQALAKKFGVDETPTYELQGKKVDGATVTELIQKDSTKLEAAIDAALASAGQ